MVALSQGEEIEMTQQATKTVEEQTTDAAAPEAPRSSGDHVALAIELIRESLSTAQAPPGEAVEALSFIIGRIIAFASQPGQVEDNVESVKASIIMSIAAHHRAAADNAKAS